MKIKWIASTLALAMLVGCADFGQTEPVLNRQSTYRPPSQQQGFSTTSSLRVTPSQPELPENTARGNRELAGIKADLDALREEQKILTTRIMGLEQENSRKDAQIKELVTLLDAMDKRFAESDKGWRDKMAELNTTIDSERESRFREQQKLSQLINSKPKKSAEATGNYTILVVQKGDNLSTIAAAAKCTVEEIKQLNNMTSDVIFVGKKLKVPTK